MHIAYRDGTRYFVDMCYAHVLFACTYWNEMVVGTQKKGSIYTCPNMTTYSSYFSFSDEIIFVYMNLDADKV